MQTNARHVEALVKAAKVLIVDDEYYSRKVIRTLLLAAGVTNIYEAADGERGLEAIRVHGPDVVLLDWQMPGMDGATFVRRVRSPDTFPYPSVPIIMLTGHGERSRVLEAMHLGVHEFLVKPVSSNALYARIAAVLTHPRPMVRRGAYYGPEPRNRKTYKAPADSYNPSLEQDESPSYKIFVN
jgi:two-component system, chemotaxis family, chemotaxis protein CheY